jgi:hypothetical protein
MKSRKFKLLSTTVTPLAAAAALAVGMTAPAPACEYGQKSAALPEAKARNGEIILAMSHEKKAPCAPNPCAAKAKGEEMANPCAAKEKAKEMANPCAAKAPCSPCAPKK